MRSIARPDYRGDVVLSCQQYGDAKAVSNFGKAWRRPARAIHQERSAVHRPRLQRVRPLGRERGGDSSDCWAVFPQPCLRSVFLLSVTALVDINQSLGNIFPSASAILNNILARYAHNTQGWALQPGPGDATANNWWDPNVAVR